MKFSKEYIKECDCPEIQGLRPKMFLCEEYVNRDGVQIQSVDKLSYKTINKPHYRKYLIWLPTGDDLDQEIVKVCKHNLWLYKVVYGLAEDEKEFGYDIEVYNADGLYWHDIAISYNTNPLIAKIKLLKELLKESGE